MASNRNDTTDCAPETCPVERAMVVLDGKWTVLVIRDLLAGPRRFGELRASLRGISPKTLTDRLRQLAAAGLLTRTMYAEIPPRVVYELTDRGRSAAPILESLAAWGRDLPAPAARGGGFLRGGVLVHEDDWWRAGGGLADDFGT